jgi:predicted alpha-1,2-mannosidase
MNLLKRLLATVVVVLSLPAFAGDVLDEVDPFIGVDGNGNVFPGVCLPFSLVRLSPDTLPPQVTSGYSSDKPIIGFSHTHTSGTGGGGRYGNFLVTPVIGEINLNNRAFERETESARPGYYSVVHKGTAIKSELTATARCGVHRYTFPASDSAAIFFDICSTRVTKVENPKASAWVMDSFGSVVSDRRIEGWVKVRGGWGQGEPHTTWFAAEFDTTPSEIVAWQNGLLQPPGSKEAKGDRCGFAARFQTQANETIGLRVGISLTGLENARKELDATSGKSFDAVRGLAEETWRERLTRIKVEGGTAEQRRVFYTSLYRTSVMPTDITGDNPRWTNDEPHFWDFYAIWDTFRCTNSLWTLIATEDHVRMLRCLVDIYRHDGWLPDSWVVGRLSQVQGGTNADMVLGEAIVKGLKGFDWETAYEAIRKDATDPSGTGHSYGRYKEYFQYGYLPISTDNGSPASLPSSRTLEYAANDFAVSQVAEVLGHKDDASRFREQSLNAFKLFNPETKFFWAKDAQGKWLEPFDPTREHHPSGLRPFYEGTPWQYAFYVPHDVQGLINRHGGSESFEKFLDQFFDTNQYDATNEPDILVPWIYAYLNRPAKNVDRVRSILSKSYNTSRKGLPGNDDSGTMSAWYIFASMGFYPVAAQDVYLMASPVFPKVEMQLAEGMTLIIIANNLSEQNRFIQSAKLNGREWTRGWFTHGDIINGAEFVFEMGPAPSTWGTQGPPPPSISKPN